MPTGSQTGKDFSAPEAGQYAGTLKQSPSRGLRRFPRRVHQLPRTLAMIVMISAILTLTGSIMGWATVSGWLPHSRLTAYGASIALFFGGASLWTWSTRPYTFLRRSVARGFAGLVLLIATGALIAMVVFYLESGSDSLSGTAFKEHPHRMPPFTVFGLILYGWALMLPNWILPHRRRPAEYLALGGTLLGLIMVLTHLYRLALDIGTRETVASSFPVSLLLMLLGIGIITSHPTGLIGTLIANQGIAGYFTRRITLLLLLFPPLLGGFRMLGKHGGWYDDALSTAMTIGIYVSIFGGAILAFAHKLYLTEKHRKSVERRLLSREFDARVAFSNAPVGIGQLKTNYTWARINRQLADIFGYSYEEFLAQPLENLIVEEDRSHCSHQLRRLLHGEITHYTAESRYLRKGGEEIWCNVTITMPADTRMGRRYAIVVMEDVTLRKQAELEIVRQKAAAEAANRAKDRFISVISHELRTPLTPVLAMLSAYQSDELTDEQRKKLSIMQRNIEHEVCLIDDLLEVTRLSHGKLQLKHAPVDLHALLTDLFETLSNSFREKKIEAVLELHAQRHHVMGDRARLRQIFLNLLDNARKFTPPGGTITLKTMQEEDRISTCVCDTGAGIPPESMERIFEAFEQGAQARAKQYGGLGLGLAICRGLVEGHRGTIQVASDGADLGASFTVTLETINEVETPVNRAPLPEARSVCILLVEDHADTRYTLQHLLQRRGHRVLAAAGMAEALTLAAAEKPDLLLSDIGLPDGDGLELRKMIYDRCGLELPAIALSGYGGDDDREASIAAGYARHLVKPVDMRQLEHSIYEALALG